MTLALVHSPLVGPATWRAAAEVLRDEGEVVVVPDLTHSVLADPPVLPAVQRAVGDAVDAARSEDPVTLVGHSGAGPLLPGIADLTAARVRGLVYVDSLLPQPGVSWFDRAPDDLADHLRRLTRGGVLPPWDEWFEAGAVVELLPDPDVRSRFVAELPHLPLAYFDEATPASVWNGPSGYLLLSEAYEDDAAEARRRGWPVLERRGHHLSMLTDPATAAAAILELIDVFT
ncbi:MAG: alpha/beta hydrolase [Jiangellaceae bacterium]